MRYVISYLQCSAVLIFFSILFPFSFHNYYASQHFCTSTIPVNGGWGWWQEWSACSQSCLGGLRERRRICDGPPPMNGGDDCVDSTPGAPGEQWQEAECNTGPCQGNREYIYSDDVGATSSAKPQLYITQNSFSSNIVFKVFFLVFQTIT